MSKDPLDCSGARPSHKDCVESKTQPESKIQFFNASVPDPLTALLQSKPKPGFSGVRELHNVKNITDISNHNFREGSSAITNEWEVTLENDLFEATQSTTVCDWTYDLV